MLLVSNDEDKNERTLNGLKHLFRDLVTFGRHIITRVIARCVNLAIHMCFMHLWHLFLFCLPLENVQISRDFTYKFSMMPFHKNP